MTDLLRRLFLLTGSRGFVDVGVNIGQTLLKVKSLDANIRYLGFEPNPFCVLYANELIRLNGFDHCEIFPIALSNAPALLELIAESEADSGASVQVGLRPDRQVFRKQHIAALVFDDLGLDASDVAVVKIDVEGAELQVLRGMSRFLQSARPLVVCEVLHAHSHETLADLATRSQGILDLLDQLEYSVLRIHKLPQRVGSLETVSMFPNVVWDSRTSGGLCDYLMVPRERTHEVVTTFAGE